MSASSAADLGEVLAEGLERYAYGTDEWKDIRDEGATDMRYLAGDPWEDEEKKARDAAGRPYLAVDELSQYVNQLINNWRQNKRGIKVSPAGNGANDRTANFRQGKIRDIEYKSKADEAYVTMFENTAQRGYGFLRIKADYVSPTSGFDQEPVIEPVPNPDLITADPDSLRTDGRDMNWLFFEEWRDAKALLRKFPEASVRNFTGDVQRQAPSWASADGKRVRLAEYWRREVAGTRELLLLKPGPASATNPTPQPMQVFVDQLGGKRPSSELILKSRKIDRFEVTQHLTNGFEILESTTWPGQSIPFVSCFGKVMYVDQGAGVKRKLMSLIRLARSPYMLYCYYRTCQMELVGMTPKFPYFVYRGQLDPEQLKNLEKSLHEPVAVIIVDPVADNATGQVLGMPQRNPYEPPIQGLELGAEACRRAIQAAMGVSPLPTDAQRQNQKSGKALDRIDASAQTGSYHFVDHADAAVVRTGEILGNELVPKYFDTAADTSIRKADDTVAVVRVNDPAARYSSKLEPAAAGMGQDPAYGHIPTDAGDHVITVSVGPAQDSEREAASDFADSIIGNAEIVQIVGPQKAAEMMALAIKLKDVGPIGDQMAELISPSQDGQGDPKQLQAKTAQLAQENQQLKQQLQGLALDRHAKTLELASRERIAKMQIDSDDRNKALDREQKIASSELSAKSERLDLFYEERARVGAQVADAGEADAQRRHEIALSGLEHGQNLDAAAHAAAIAPPPPMPDTGASAGA